jgi:hypothetical protein
VLHWMENEEMIESEWRGRNRAQAEILPPAQRRPEGFAGRKKAMAGRPRNPVEIMETHTTSFDINRTIQQWREDFAQSDAFRGDNLDELEAHLRDSIANLERHSLTTAEAFLIASRRIGSDSALSVEFGKINSRRVWLNRAFWMLIGVQAMSVVHALISMFTSGAITLAAWQAESSTNTSTAPWIVGLFSASIHLLTFAVMLALGWRLLVRKSKDISAWFRAAPKSPSRTVAVIGAWFAVWLIPGLVQGGSTAFLSRVISANNRGHFLVGITYGTLSASFFESVALIVLTLLLARRLILTKTWA